ncbi:MAG: hypothetical protein CMF62_03530 [Magnetococcales bacterium]|nr:hypothetical protein [Magnetococcales bacterium]
MSHQYNFLLIIILFISLRYYINLQIKNKIDSLVSIQKINKKDYLNYVSKNISYYKNRKYFQIIQKKDIRANPKAFYNNFYNPMITTYKTAANNWGETNNVTARMSKYDSIKTSIKFLTNTRNAIPSATGGSSGKSFYQLYNYNDMLEGARGFLRCLVNLGYDYRKHSILLLYAHGNNFIQILNTLQYILPNFYAMIPKMDSKCDFTDKTVYEIFNIIENKKPNFVISFPSTIFRYCEKTLEKKLKHKHNPIGFDLSADFLLTCQYEFIKTIFPNSKVRMSYGTVEFGQIAQQKDDKNHLVYKVFDDLCEVSNHNKNLVVTKFSYKVQPLINYMVDDHCEVYKIKGNTYIKNLVGKKHQDDKVDILKLDSKINMINKLVNNNIINAYYDDNNIYLSLKNRNINNIGIISRYIPNVIFKYCGLSNCKTLQKYCRKVIPYLKKNIR